mmetsp:Transcript_5228/g.7569  ORF Transcript_5228/g.7569 Transcript_5228/m.7569 type:complete len:293 (+) Transcript_5228:241-1119(+)
MLIFASACVLVLESLSWKRWLPERSRRSFCSSCWTLESRYVMTSWSAPICSSHRFRLVTACVSDSSISRTFSTRNSLTASVPSILFCRSALWFCRVLTSYSVCLRFLVMAMMAFISASLSLASIDLARFELRPVVDDDGTTFAFGSGCLFGDGSGFLGGVVGGVNIPKTVVGVLTGGAVGFVVSDTGCCFGCCCSLIPNKASTREKKAILTCARLRISVASKKLKTDSNTSGSMVSRLGVRSSSSSSSSNDTTATSATASSSSSAAAEATSSAVVLLLLLFVLLDCCDGSVV